MAEDNFEDGFGNANTMTNPNTKSGSSGVDVNSLNDYVFIENTYKGIAGYKNGKYLIPHQREMFYDQRRQFSHYTNFIRPIIRAMYEPVFIKPVNREYEDNKLFETFIKDVNGNNTNIQRFTEMVTEYNRLFSVCFIVMDSLNEEGSLTLDEAIKNGETPYCYIKKPYDVEDYILSKFGKLQSIMFYERCEKDEQGNKKLIYRKWTSTETAEYTKSNNQNGEIEYTEIPGTKVVHNLGVLPVITVLENERDDISVLLPEPKMYSMTKINHTIYNQDSERRELQRKNGFSILSVQEDVGGNNPAGKTLSTNNYLSIPIDATNMPQYVSPDPNLLKGLLEEREHNRNDLFNLAEQLGVIGTTKEAKSGLALSFEFQAYESTLQKSSSIATCIENQITELFQAWTGQTFNFKVDYPKEFKPNTNVEKINLYDIVMQWHSLPDIMEKQILLDTQVTFFPKTEDIIIEETKKEIDEKEDFKEPDFEEDQKEDE